jgi:superfamily II DNA/RNA helicase
LFFSATMPQEITRLADQMLRDPARVAVTPQSTTVERIAQRVIHTDKAAKQSLLAELLKSEQVDRVLIFTRTKHGADKVVRGLQKSGFAAEAIHGNKSQNQRERVLAAFRDGSMRTLVATDIAARGIDVDGVSHVFNDALPTVQEIYVHSSGRTARAARDGIAISFCDHEERAYLRDIERLIRMSIPASDRRTGKPVAAQAQTEAHGHPSHNNGGRNGGSNGAKNGRGRGGKANNGHNGHRNGHHAAQGEPRGRRQHDQHEQRPQGHNEHRQHAKPEHGRGEPKDFRSVSFMQRPGGAPRRNAGHRAPR